MSKLFDDASLAMIPSAYKDGKLYSIRPIPEYGAELVTNGGFDTDSDWIKGTNWAISSGSLNATSATDKCEQNTSVTTNKTYLVSYNITNYVSGSVRIELSSGNVSVGATNSGNGFYSEEITALGDGYVLIDAMVTFTGSIDNVSVKEVLKPSGDFTFSRGSNLAATRVDVNGLIEKGRENLLTYSNDISQWTNAGTTEASGFVGYDGTNDAWEIEKISPNAYSSIFKPLTATSGIVTISAYVKKGTLSVTSLYANGGTNPYILFSFDSGTISTQRPGLIDTNVEDKGNGWYRISFTTTDSITQVTLHPDWSGTNTGTIYVQDIQVEQGLVATDYIETGASTAQAGILEDMPRLDYSGGASCPSLLLEPQRSNILPYSEYFENYPKVIGGTGVTPIVTTNYGVGPEGVQNATRVQFDAGSNGYSSLRQYVGGLGIPNTASKSVYIKSLSGNVSVNLGDGLTGSELLSVTTEWQRFDVTDTVTYTGTHGFHLMTNTASGNPLTTQSVDILIWGAQIELGSYPTSYIPTYGTSQTRSGDDMDTTFSSAFTTNGGVSVLFDIKGTDKKSGLSANGRYLNFATNSTLTTPFIAYNRTDEEHRIRVYDGTSSTYTSTEVDIENDVKIVIVAEGDTHKVFSNGVLRFTRTTNSIDWSSITDFVQTSDDSIGVIDVKQLLLFPTSLTDAECIALTTL